MIRQFIKNNITLVAIVIFLFLFTIIVLSKPALLFNKDGSARKFGIGFKNKTVVPIWLVSILIGILAYFIVLYYITFPKFL